MKGSESCCSVLFLEAIVTTFSSSPRLGLCKALPNLAVCQWESDVGPGTSVLCVKPKKALTHQADVKPKAVQTGWRFSSWFPLPSGAGLPWPGI